MDKKIKEVIKKYNLTAEKAVVLAISGGPDSIVLLDLFVRLFPKEKLVVAHANHGLRLESRFDENFVRALADEYNLSFECERLRLTSDSEAVAREARYAFLREVKAEYQAKYILTAHHLNDQAETILLALTRGTGPLGGWGMAELEGDILRPLLSVGKKEILSYAKGRHLRYHLDRTNYDPRYARNRVRRKVIPQLQKINPGFFETVNRNAELGFELKTAWTKEINAKKKRIESENGLDLRKLGKETSFVQKELIKSKLEEALDRPEGVSRENVEKVWALLALPRGKKTEIGKIEIVKGNKYLAFGAKKKPAVFQERPKVKLVLNQSVEFGPFKFKMSEDNGRATKNNILIPKSFGYNLNIRTWREGDRIKTKAGTKKLSDVFVDAKIPAAAKKNWPVVVAGRQIVWLPKLTAFDGALSEAKKKVIRIEVRNARPKK